MLRSLNQQTAKIPVVTNKALAEDEAVQDSVGAVAVKDSAGTVHLVGQQHIHRAGVLRTTATRKHIRHPLQSRAMWAATI